MSDSLLTLLLAVSLSFISMGFLLIVVLFYKNHKNSFYNTETQRVQLDRLRSELERQSYILSDRMTATNDKWRDVNHPLVTVTTKSAPLEKLKGTIDPNIFLSWFGISPNPSIDRKKVFVLMPMHKQYFETYSAIHQGVTSIGLQCVRGDEERIEGDIFSRILQEIITSRFVIAVLDGRNPNVYYELGIAQALGKPTLLVSQSPNEIPFDLQSQQILMYYDMHELTHKIQTTLSRMVISSDIDY